MDEAQYTSTLRRDAKKYYRLCYGSRVGSSNMSVGSTDISSASSEVSSTTQTSAGVDSYSQFSSSQMSTSFSEAESEDATSVSFSDASIAASDKELVTTLPGGKMTLDFRIHDPREEEQIYRLYQPMFDWIDPNLYIYDIVMEYADDFEGSRRSNPLGLLEIPSLAIVMFLRENNIIGSDIVAIAQEHFQSSPWKFHHTESIARANIKTSPDNNQDYFLAKEGYPLCSIRKLHDGKPLLRFVRFISAEYWTENKNFYSLVLGQDPEVTKPDFCLFTTGSCEAYDIQLALKRSPRGISCKPTPNVSLSFRINRLGNLVPLLPHSCQTKPDDRWETRDLDGNHVMFEVVKGPERERLSVRALQQHNAIQTQEAVFERLRQLRKPHKLSKSYSNLYELDEYGAFSPRNTSQSKNTLIADYTSEDSMSEDVYIRRYQKKKRSRSIPHRTVSMSVTPVCRQQAARARKCRTPTERTRKKTLSIYRSNSTTTDCSEDSRRIPNSSHKPRKNHPRSQSVPEVNMIGMGLSYSRKLSLQYGMTDGTECEYNQYNRPKSRVPPKPPVRTTSQLSQQTMNNGNHGDRTGSAFKVYSPSKSKKISPRTGSPIYANLNQPAQRTVSVPRKGRVQSPIYANIEHSLPKGSIQAIVSEIQTHVLNNSHTRQLNQTPRDNINETPGQGNRDSNKTQENNWRTDNHDIVNGNHNAEVKVDPKSSIANTVKDGPLSKTLYHGPVENIRNIRSTHGGYETEDEVIVSNSVSQFRENDTFDSGWVDSYDCDPDDEDTGIFDYESDLGSACIQLDPDASIFSETDSACIQLDPDASIFSETDSVRLDPEASIFSETDSLCIQLDPEIGIFSDTESLCIQLDSEIGIPSETESPCPQLDPEASIFSDAEDDKYSEVNIDAPYLYSIEEKSEPTTSPRYRDPPSGEEVEEETFEEAAIDVTPVASPREPKPKDTTVATTSPASLNHQKTRAVYTSPKQSDLSNKSAVSPRQPEPLKAPVNSPKKCEPRLTVANSVTDRDPPSGEEGQSDTMSSESKPPGHGISPPLFSYVQSNPFIQQDKAMKNTARNSKGFTKHNRDTLQNAECARVGNIQGNRTDPLPAHHQGQREGTGPIQSPGLSTGSAAVYTQSNETNKTQVSPKRTPNSPRRVTFLEKVDSHIYNNDSCIESDAESQPDTGLHIQWQRCRESPVGFFV